MDAYQYENVPRRVNRTRSYHLVSLLSPKRSGSFNVAKASCGMFETSPSHSSSFDGGGDHVNCRQPTTSLMARMKEAFERASNKVRTSASFHGKPMNIEHPIPSQWMLDRDTETSLRYLREVIRTGRREVLASSGQAVLNSLANCKNHNDPQLQDALINLLQYIDGHVGPFAATSLDQNEGTRLVDILQKEIVDCRNRPQPEPADTTFGAYVEEPDDENPENSLSQHNASPDPALDALLSQLNLRQVAKFEPKFPDIDADSEDEGGVTVDERKEERAEKHGQKTCEEEIEKLPDGTEVRRKKTRTVNLSQSSRQVTISTRGGGVPSVSRRFADGSHSMNDDTDFENTDFFSSPFSKLRRDRNNFMNTENINAIGSTSEPGQSQKTKTVEATSEITQSVAQKTQRNGRVLADNAAHQIDTTELTAKQIETYQGQQLLDRKGDGTYEEATIVRSGLPGIERASADTPVKKHVVEYIQTFGTKKDATDDEFLRGTTLASYVVLNDSLRLHEEQFRKKLTFEFSSSGISTSQTDFSNLAELLQNCSDFSKFRLPTKFQDSNEQKSITYPERKAIGAPKIVLECIDATEYLVLKERDDAVRPSEIRGGPSDALIVYATQSNGSLLYQEAFLATFRTFVPSQDLLQKLIHRYIYMVLSPELSSQKAARLTFSVIVRVVDELCPVELTKDLVASVTNFVYKLIRDGNFQLARLLRTRLIDRIEASATKKESGNYLERMKRPDTLFDFRSLAVAHQLTLMDQQLFHAIDASEMLWWAEQQDEKKCPNLAAFTEQFNKMSYWVRTTVLTPKEHKERERYLNKFIKIMKQLRRLGNFNAYLAILSALDSGPVRRLEWSKNATEQLKEHAHIMDSSGSFKNYRTALVETSPPCIPYVGLILQDLTFVHVGNVNFLQPESVGGRKDLLNFGKRWQQFAILDSIRKFKRWNYSFTRDERIINVFNGFTALSEDATWELSESIKPRQRRNP